MKHIERIAAFFADIIAIAVGIITIKKNIVKSRWSKFLISFFVGIALLATVSAIVLFAIDTLTDPDKGNTVTTVMGDYHNDTINNYYYASIAGGGYTERINNADGTVTTVPPTTSAWDGSNEERQTYSLEECTVPHSW